MYTVKSHFKYITVQSKIVFFHNLKIEVMRIYGFHVIFTFFLHTREKNGFSRV